MKKNSKNKKGMTLVEVIIASYACYSCCSGKKTES